MTQDVRYKYFAFVSYSHKDSFFGEKIQRSIEQYNVSGDMVGRETRFGPVPGRLRPVFRDRWDLSAGHNLDDQIAEAISASAFLLVVCSRSSAKSRYVNSEIIRFKQLGRAERIFALIVDGEPNDPEKECFPPALKFKIDALGQHTNEPEQQPIAADARPHGDGFDLAKLKIIAGMLGVGLDEIVRRDLRDQKRRRRRLASVAAAFLLLALTSAIEAYRIKLISDRHEKLLSATLQKAGRLVNTAVQSAHDRGVPALESIRFLDQVEPIFTDIGSFGADTPDLKKATADFRGQYADMRGILGDHGAQMASAEEAVKLITAAIEQAGPRPQLEYALGSAIWHLGKAYRDQAKHGDAIEQFDRCVAVLRQLKSTSKEERHQRYRLISECQRDKSSSYLVTKDLQQSVDVLYSSIAELTPELDNDEGQEIYEGVLKNYYLISEAKRQQGKLEDSIKIINDNLFKAQELARSERDSAIAIYAEYHQNLGDVFQDTKHHEKARDQFEIALSIYENQYAKDTSNAFMKRRSAFARVKLGEALVLLGENERALGHFEQAAKMLTPDIQRDPRSIALNNVMSYAIEDIANVALMLKQPERARDAYIQRLEISKRLVDADSNNRLGLRSMAEANLGLARVYVELGDYPQALAAAQTALDIRKNLATIDTHPRAKPNWAVALEQTADIETKMGALRDASDHLKQAQSIRGNLAEEAPGDASRKMALAQLLKALAEVSLRQKECGDAAAYYKEALSAVRAASAPPTPSPQAAPLEAEYEMRLQSLPQECSAR
jgi:eukaryotic-like serine/threonine-protein kinase